MKGTVFEIKRFAVHDGDGIRTTVFFKGCSLRCVWCHNPEGLETEGQLAYFENKCVACGICGNVCKNEAHRLESGVHIFKRDKCIACGKCEQVCDAEALKLYGRKMSTEELLPILIEDRDFYESSGGGVTLSGGECLLQADFCRELLKKLKENGINTAVDTCGMVSKAAIDKVMPYTDVFLYDIKAIDSEVHKKCTGYSNEQIIENLKYIDSCGAKTEIRFPYVPGFNSNQTEKIAKLLITLENVIGVRVLPYHSLAGSKYKSIGIVNTLPEAVVTDAQIKAAGETFRKYNIKVK